MIYLFILYPSLIFFSWVCEGFTIENDGSSGYDYPF